MLHHLSRIPFTKCHLSKIKWFRSLQFSTDEGESLENKNLHEFVASRMDDFVLVRHGESEGNVARKRSIHGDHSLYSGEFKNRHSGYWRLTDRGREQAMAAGEWIKRNISCTFDRYYVSEYLRAMETAGRLGLPGANWFAEMLIRERDWGQMDLMSEEERVTTMFDELKRRDLDRFYYAPPGGESLAAVAQRADRLLGTLHRECSNKKVIVVCHGEVMWALRTRLERMSQETFRGIQESGRMVDQIHNGHILHYTRRNPVTGEKAPYFSWMRSVCPWDLRLSPKGWRKIERPVYDNEMLIATAERVPRMIVSEEYLQQTYKPSKKKLSNIAPVEYPRSEPLTMKNVLMTQKMTRFQYEKMKHGDSTDELRKRMSLRGFVYDRLRASHDAHMEAMDDIQTSFKKNNINCKVVFVNNLKKEDLVGIDAVISAGGDGTFLKSASLVDQPIPLIGLNTDPTRSEGRLCCYSLDPTKERFDEVLRRLYAGEFRWRHRQRARIVLVQQDGSKEELPRYALNEVFFAESDASRPTFYDLGIDQMQREIQRSSGLIVCTGTGSTAWYYSASQNYREQVSCILKEMGHLHTNEFVTEITEAVNKEHIFSEESLDMGYLVREPIINATYGHIRHRCGIARRVSIRSLGWDVKLTIDGMYSVPLEYGCQAVMKIGLSPTHLLRTIEFFRKNDPPKRQKMIDYAGNVLE